MALFNILVDIATRTANFEAGMQRAEKRLEAFTAGATKLARTAGTLTGVTLGFDALRRSVGAAIERGDELQRLAERMDTTAKSLSQLEYVAKQSDIQFDTLASSLDTFTKNVGMASVGTGKAQKALKELGIDAKELYRLGLDEQLDLVADAIARIDNSTRQGTLTSQLFGDADMLSALKDGSAGIRALREESDRTGFSLENELAKKLALADDAMKRLDSSSQALTTTLTGWLAPALVRVVDGMNAVLSGDFSKNLSSQLDDLANRRNELLQQQKNLESSWISKLLLGDGVDAALENVRANIAAVEAEMNRVNELMLKRNAAAGTGAKGTSGSTFVDLSATDRRLETMREFAANIKELEERDDLLQMHLADTIKARDDLMRVLDAGIKEGLSDTAYQAADGMRQLSDQIEDSIKRAQASTVFIEEMQRSLFGNVSGLIEDLGDGVDAFGERMINTFKKILADAATNELFKYLAGLGKSLTASAGTGGSFWGTALTSLFGGYKAEGGPLQQGKWYVAGEKGPEPIWGGGPGAYAMGYGSGGGGSVTINMPIDARGATADAVKMLPAVAKAASDDAVNRVLDLKRRGKL